MNCTMEFGFKPNQRSALYKIKEKEKCIVQHWTAWRERTIFLSHWCDFDFIYITN